MIRPRNLRLACGLLALAAAATPSAHSRAKERRERWTVKDVMVPTRDGVRLHTKVFVPNDQKEPLPFLMARTPYGTADAAERLESGAGALVDEGTDTYDTIQWLLGNVTPNNGRVGMFGVSYLGWTTIMGALEPHPALKAISPQASPADMWRGDDFHHNGAFRLFVPNIFEAKAGDFRPATHRIHRSAR
ncbi:MAG: hypothetical protein DMF79_02715 [Acidobacteria bacterium]|nr:MAG: hypothetical protein DMF79_02715 [Acidobacteriota bacterium]